MIASIRRISIVALMFAGVVSTTLADDASPAPLNTLTDAEVAAGWKLLFDGKTTQGWHNYRKDTISDGWKVIDGALVMSRRGSGDIVTQDEYGAFELSIDFKISPSGNSGVIYHVKNTGTTPWQTGPEIQIQDNVAGHDPQKCGWLYQLYSSEVDATKPAGQWNTLRVVISPEKCEHYMNGVKYCEYVKGSEDWKQKVAASKFAKFEGFGEAKEGHLCLQDHNDEVAYRNIKIRPL
ncbi:MAG: 3-keto-disaccharide hydrolase [Planctomycetaceae bacterium]